jgi:type VI secretion system secreted protein Hcp
MAQDIFMQIDGVDGESTDNAHRNEIQIVSWSYGHRNSIVNGVVHGEIQDLLFTMYTNKASPKLLLACAMAMPLRSAKLTCRRAGENPVEYLRIKLSEILVSSFEISAGVEDFAVEQVALRFGRIEYEYVPFNFDGSPGMKVLAAWDISKIKTGDGTDKSSA